MIASLSDVSPLAPCSLVVSAHWEEKKFTVQTGAKPPMVSLLGLALPSASLLSPSFPPLPVFLSYLFCLPPPPPAHVLAPPPCVLPTVFTRLHCPLLQLFDYFGFPDYTYELDYPAPGHPDLARRVARLLTDAGLGPVGEDSGRGFDHGVFIPVRVTLSLSSATVAPTLALP